MKTLQHYLDKIHKDSASGWGEIYSDLLGNPLYGMDNLDFNKGLELFGESIMLEAVIVTSNNKVDPSGTMKYLLAVARNLWKEELASDLAKEQSEIRLERMKRTVMEDNSSLAERIEEAKRRVDAKHTL